MKQIKDLTNEQLLPLLMSIIHHEDTGHTERAELLLPMATELREHIGGDYTLKEALEKVQNDVLVEAARRYTKLVKAIWDNM